MHDPAHDPERRMPRATRGPDENFLPKSAVTGSSRNEVHTSSPIIPPSQDRTIDNRGTSEGLYPWHKEEYDHSDPGPPYYTGTKLETVMDRMEQAMHTYPLPYRPNAVRTSPQESAPTHSAADRNRGHWNES